MDEQDLMRAQEQERAAWAAEDWPLAARLNEELARALPQGPESAPFWFDAALAHKFLRDWPKALELGRIAAGLVESGTEEPAFWNLGIAATALGEWSLAREAWIGYGIPGIEPGEDEIEADFGPTCVRIADEDGRQEVVWARRICPTRARVLSIPMGVRGHRFGEIVLHDGAPNGERVSNGDTFPVFDQLQLWQAGELPAWTVDLTAPDPSAYDGLGESFTQRNFAAEAQSSMKYLCSCCSEGTVHQDTHEVSGAQRMWFAAPEDELKSLLGTWLAEDPQGRSAGEIQPVLA